MYGKGCWKSSDGLEIYEGGFANNKREGNGTLVLRNGDRYTGEFHLHKFHGRGSYLRENVVFLESDFENGGISGKCQIQWHKIATYIGECQENKLHGRGYYRSFDGSYETETTFNNSLPEYNVNGYDLKIDRSMCVEDVIDPKGKDKKKEKEKKKPAGKKGSSVMDVESMISISPGDPIGLIAISLHFKGIDKSPTGLPNSDELRRALSVSLREYTPQTSTEHPDAGLGEVVPIWRRNPTLEEYAVAWERFPPNSFRFINGVNPLTGDSVGFEGMSEFTSLHDPSTKVISTLLKSSIPNKLRITAPVQTFRAKNPQLSFLLDFKLIPSANLMSEENSPLRSVRYNDINYRSIVILSWSLVLDNASVFSLCLLVPNPVETTWKNCYWELCSNDVALCRWVENQIFDVNSWHSIGLSLFLDGDSLSQVKSNLYVDGDGRMRLIEGDDPSLQEFLLTEDTERVWQVGGETHAAIDALIKNFALFSEYISLLCF